MNETKRNANEIISDQNLILLDDNRGQSATIKKTKLNSKPKLFSEDLFIIRFLKFLECICQVNKQLLCYLLKFYAFRHKTIHSHFLKINHFHLIQ